MVTERDLVERLQVRYRGGGNSALLRQEVERVLGEGELKPPNFPAGAVLVVREIRDLPVLLRGTSGENDWKRELRLRIAHLYRTAARPAIDTAPDRAASVIFYDPGEMLACFARDIVYKRAGEKWYWRNLLRHSPRYPEAALAQVMESQPDFVPAAMVQLSLEDAAAVVSLLPFEDQKKLTEMLHTRFALPRPVSPLLRSATAPAAPATLNLRRAFPPPWERWLSPLDRVEMTVQARYLLGLSVSLYHRPAFTRSEFFAAQAEGWVISCHETASGPVKLPTKGGFREGSGNRAGLNWTASGRETRVFPQNDGSLTLETGKVVNLFSPNPPGTLLVLPEIVSLTENKFPFETFSNFASLYLHALKEIKIFGSSWSYRGPIILPERAGEVKPGPGTPEVRPAPVYVLEPGQFTLTLPGWLSSQALAPGRGPGWGYFPGGRAKTGEASGWQPVFYGWVPNRVRPRPFTPEYRARLSAFIARRLALPFALEFALHRLVLPDPALFEEVSSSALPLVEKSWPVQPHRVKETNGVTAPYSQPLFTASRGEAILEAGKSYSGHTLEPEKSPSSQPASGEKQLPSGEGEKLSQVSGRITVSLNPEPAIAGSNYGLLPVRLGLPLVETLLHDIFAEKPLSPASFPRRGGPEKMNARGAKGPAPFALTEFVPLPWGSLVVPHSPFTRPGKDARGTPLTPISPGSPESLPNTGTDAEVEPSYPVFAIETKNLFSGQAIPTQLGGVLFLVHLLSWLDLPNSWAEDPAFAEYMSGWAIVETLARFLLGRTHRQHLNDPIWQILMALDGREPGTPAGSGLAPSPSFRLPAAWLARYAPSNNVWSATLEGKRLCLTDRTAGFCITDIAAGELSLKVAAATEIEAYLGQGVKATWEEGTRREPLTLTPGVAKFLSPGAACWGGRMGGFVRYLLGKALRDDSPQALEEALCREGLLYVSRTHLDLVMDLRNVNIASRRAGLDRNPGWVSDLGRIIYFHYE